MNLHNVDPAMFEEAAQLMVWNEWDYLDVVGDHVLANAGNGVVFLCDSKGDVCMNNWIIIKRVF